MQVNVTCKFSGVFPLPSVKLTWGSFDLFADKMTAHINPSSSCYEVTIHKVGKIVKLDYKRGLKRQYFTFLSHRFSPTLSCLQRRPLAARFISQGPSILSGITLPPLNEKNGMFSFLPFLIALICREEARYDQHEQHRTRRSPKIFQPIGVKH